MNSVQVVILTNNNGNGLYPFSEAQSSYTLPIANKPVLAYVLESLIANHLHNFIFICNENNKEEIEKYVEKKFHWPVMPYRSLQFYAPTEYESTIQSISNISQQNILTQDVMIINGDSISECNIIEMLLLHYGNRNLLTVAYHNRKNEENILFMEKGTINILKTATLEDLEDEGLKIKKIVAKKFKEIELKNNVELSNIFILSKKVLPVFTNFTKEFDSFAKEFVPFFIEHQFHKKLRRLFSTQKKTSNVDFIPDETHQTSFDKACHAYNQERVQMYLFTGYHKQINSLDEFKAANFDAINSLNKESLFNQTENNEKRLFVESTDPKVKFVSNIFGINSEALPSKEIKKSVFGRNCKIKTVGKIENSIIFNDVEIEDECEIINSVVGSKTVIKSGSKIVNCFIGNNNVIPERSLFKDETLKSEEPVESDPIRKMSIAN